MKEEGTKTPTELEAERGKEGEGSAFEGPTGRKEQSAVDNTVQCCSAPLSGMEGRARTKASSSRGVLPFSPYGCGRLTGCSSHRGRMLSIWTHEVRRLSSVTTGVLGRALGGVSLVTA